MAEKKTSVSGALTSKYAGAAAAKAQAEYDSISAQRAEAIRRKKEITAMGTSGEKLTQEQANALSVESGKIDSSMGQYNTDLLAAQQRVNDPLSTIDVKQRDIIKGAGFGETVLGEEGLGRAGDNADIQTGMANLREQAQGFSSGEALARKEQAVGNLNSAQEGQRRRLQAALAKSGVRGGVAGNQLAAQATDAIGQRANMERDLFLAGEDAKRSGTQNLLSAAGELSKFDLGQAAKEKNIILQSGMGFAQMGAAERGAKMQAQASERAAAASAPRCHVAGSQVLMADKTYKNIEDIQVGDEVYLGGQVKIKGEAIAEDSIYEFNGEFVTGSHVVYSEVKQKYIRVKELNIKGTNLPKDTIVYPLMVENGFYITKSGAINGDFLTEEQEEGITIKSIRKDKLKRLANL